MCVLLLQVSDFELFHCPKMVKVRNLGDLDINAYDIFNAIFVLSQFELLITTEKLK